VPEPRAARRTPAPGLTAGEGAAQDAGGPRRAPRPSSGRHGRAAPSGRTATGPTAGRRGDRATTGAPSWGRTRGRGRRTESGADEPRRRAMAGTYAAPSVTRSGTKRKRDGEKGAGRAHLEERRRRGQVQGGGSPVGGRWGKREALGERFAQGREKNASSWEREDEQGVTCLRLTGGPHRGRAAAARQLPSAHAGGRGGRTVGAAGPRASRTTQGGGSFRGPRGGGGGKKAAGPRDGGKTAAGPRGG
jgi:hypothetical protein